MKYAAVIFDLFGTLVDSPSIIEREKVLKEMDSILSASSVEFSRTWSITGTERDTGRLGDLKTTIRHVCSQLGINPTESQVELISQIRLKYMKGLIRPTQATIEILNRLRRIGCKIGLISDSSIEIPTVWNETPLASLTDESIFSCSVGMKKPDSRIYQIAADRLGVLVSNCLYVGDGGSRELSGASRVAMEAVLISANRANPDAHVIDQENWPGRSILSLGEILNWVE